SLAVSAATPKRLPITTCYPLAKKRSQASANRKTASTRSAAAPDLHVSQPDPHRHRVSTTEILAPQHRLLRQLEVPLFRKCGTDARARRSGGRNRFLWRPPRSRPKPDLSRRQQYADPRTTSRSSD